MQRISIPLRQSGRGKPFSILRQSGVGEKTGGDNENNFDLSEGETETEREGHKLKQRERTNSTRGKTRVKRLIYTSAVKKEKLQFMLMFATYGSGRLLRYQCRVMR